jgi:hypothetical protein
MHSSLPLNSGVTRPGASSSVKEKERRDNQTRTRDVESTVGSTNLVLTCKICKNYWRNIVFLLAICFWELANLVICQVKFTKLLEMLLGCVPCTHVEA